MEKKVEFYKFNTNSYNEISKRLTHDLKNRIKKFMRLYRYRKMIILCIGSPRATFDSFGPLVGSKLTEIINNPNIKIYGTMENPLNAKNIELFFEMNIFLPLDISPCLC